MKSTPFRTICHFLITSLVTMSFHVAQAGMIGVDELATMAPGTADRAAVVSFMDRADVRAELQARGIDADIAKERVATLTDAEVAAIKGRIDALPAGAAFGPSSTGVALAALVIAAIVLIIVRILSGYIATGQNQQ